MTNKEIARKFKLLGQLMEFHGQNSFRVKATNSVAAMISKFPESLCEKTNEDLVTIPGIGKSTALKIKELVQTGTLKELDDLLMLTPPELLSIINIRGIGAKKAYTFWKELKVDSLDALLKACKEDKLSKVKGFGQKTQQEIQGLVEFTIANKGKFRYADALTTAEHLFKLLEGQIVNPTELAFTGAFRRKSEILSSIDYLIVVEKEDLLMFVKDNPAFSEIREETDFIEAIYNKLFLVRFFLCKKEEFFARLVETTGNDVHVNALMALLKGKIPTLETEEEIYEKAGLSFILPIRREGLNEIEQAKEGKLPLIVQSVDLKGSLHNHSTWSDGLYTIEEMALYCRDHLKLEYFGISDHSKTAIYADGLKTAEIFQQWKEIDELNEKLTPFHIFRGIESDILSNGDLDYPDEILSEFDFVVASIHSQLGMDRKKATARLIKAIENPYTTILGHPTARQLLIRKGYEIDHKKVIDACAANNVVIEINSNPLRLDIDWRWIPYCIEKGVMLSINPDAHTIAELHYTDFGINMAQKGGLTKESCLNCLSLEGIKGYFEKRKSNIISKFEHD